MPAVRVEVGYLSNMGDLRRLMDPAFRDVVAEGILVAVKRLYLLGQDDQPTGTFTFGDVLARELRTGPGQGHLITEAAPITRQRPLQRALSAPRGARPASGPVGPPRGRRSAAGW